MEIEILKKKLSSYRTTKGRLTKVSDELLFEILQAWEQWTGPASGFYASLGADHRKMASLIGRAKKLKREGFFPQAEFQEVRISETTPGTVVSMEGCIEIAWDNNRIIRFSGVPQLIEFLIKFPQSQSVAQEVKKVG